MPAVLSSAVELRVSSACMVKLPSSGADLVTSESDSEIAPFVDSLSGVFSGWIVIAAKILGHYLVAFPPFSLVS